MYPSLSSRHLGLFSRLISSLRFAMCFSESAFRVTLLNCKRIGDIFNQLAKEEMIANCSSSERSIKFMGSISRIFRYLSSTVSIIPCLMFFTGMKSCEYSFRFAHIVGPPKMNFSSVHKMSEYMTDILQQRIAVYSHHRYHR